MLIPEPGSSLSLQLMVPFDYALGGHPQNHPPPSPHPQNNGTDSARCLCTLTESVTPRIIFLASYDLCRVPGTRSACHVTCPHKRDVLEAVWTTGRGDR